MPLPPPPRPARSVLPWRRHLLRLALLLAIGGAAASRAQDCPPPPVVPDAPTLEALEAAPQDRGPLWRLTRDGHVSYLMGSMHLGRAAWIVPGPALRDAWAATDTLIVEIDPATVTAEQLRGPGRVRPLSRERSRRLAAQARAECLDPAWLSGLPPMLQLATLTTLAARRDGLEAAFGVEALLLARARQEQRPVIALETVDIQLDAMAAGDARTEARQIDDGLARLKDGRSRAQTRRLADLWERADLVRLGDPLQWCDCAGHAQDLAALVRLNDARNPAMAERISAEHGRGRRLLVAVGALHMTGARSLPRLLGERGFQVEALVPAP